MAAIYQCYRKIVDTIWSPNVWLPPNTTWADIAPESSQEVQHADYRHLFYPLPMALVVLLIRYLFEKYWFAPVGISLGIKSSRPKKAPPIPLLESTYAKSKKWKHKQVQSLAKQLDMSERQVERWLRLRKGQNKPSTLTKFCENAWRCTYYTFSFIYGITVLWDKPWLWDINECWKYFICIHLFSTSIEAPKIVPLFPAYYIFNGLLCVLLVLHIFWTYLILKIAYNSLNAGLMEGDIRSSSDDFSEDSNNSNSLANRIHEKKQ
ncbi:hypothetical protein YQE_11876, partial [Dendroctonus ponderosae]